VDRALRCFVVVCLDDIPNDRKLFAVDVLEVNTAAQIVRDAINRVRTVRTLLGFCGSVGTAGIEAFLPLTAGFALYGSSAGPQPSVAEAATDASERSSANRTFMDLSGRKRHTRAGANNRPGQGRGAQER